MASHNIQYGGIEEVIEQMLLVISLWRGKEIIAAGEEILQLM